MKKSVQKKWIKALYSGEYKQDSLALHTGKGFCCLGVLCEIAAKEGVVSKAIDENGQCIYDHETGYLPEKVREWAGMKSVKGEVFEDCETLAYLNDAGLEDTTIDNSPFTFEEIAGIIQIAGDQL